MKDWVPWVVFFVVAGGTTLFLILCACGCGIKKKAELSQNPSLVLGTLQAALVAVLSATTVGSTFFAKSFYFSGPSVFVISVLIALLAAFGSLLGNFAASKSAGECTKCLVWTSVCFSSSSLLILAVEVIILFADLAQQPGNAFPVYGCVLASIIVAVLAFFAVVLTWTRVLGDDEYSGV